MKHVIEHHLNEAESKRVADKAFEQYKTRFSKYEPRMTWLSERRADVSFTVKGVSLKGSIELKPKALEIDLDVPFLFRVFRAPAIKVLEEEVKKVIAASESEKAMSGTGGGTLSSASA